MRILFVHSIGKNKYGGGERWVVNAASGLHNKGHFVRVAGRKDSVLLNEVSGKGVQTVVFDIRNDINIFQAYRLSRFIRKHQIDVIICKSRELAVCGMAAKWSGNPVVIRRTGSPPPSRSKKLARRTRKFVKGVVTNTTTIKDIYLNHGFTQQDFVKVIYNGMHFDDEVSPFDFTKVFPGKTIGLCVGRTVGHKGYFFLIDALSTLKQTHPELLFYVLGDGKDKERLISYAREKQVDQMIHFAGYVHEPVTYYKGCDFFLHPSLYEGMPNAAMEAMAYGKPVIMTRVNGADELSENGRFARLIPAANAQAISNAVARALENKVDFMEMGQKARKMVRERYGMNTMIDELEHYLLARMKHYGKQAKE